MPREVIPRAAAPDGLASDLIATLRDRSPRAALFLAAAQLARPAVARLRDEIRDRTTYTVRVPSTDDIFDDLHAWVLTLLPAAEQRALVAWSSRAGAETAVPGEASRPRPPVLRLRYDGTREQEIRVAGHRIRVVVSEVERGDDGRGWKPPEITFTMSSATARDALLSEMAGILDRAHGGAPAPGGPHAEPVGRLGPPGRPAAA